MTTLSTQLTTEKLSELGFSIDDLIKVSSADLWLELGHKQVPAYCSYDFNDDYTPVYGHLYNWYAIKHLSKQQIPAVKLPSKDDFEEIQKLYGSADNAGKALKSIENWIHPDEENGEFGNGSNQSGTNIQPIGMINENAAFLSLGQSAFLWSMTQDDWSELQPLREFLNVPEENLDNNYSNAFSFGLTFFDDSFLDYTTLKECGLSLCLLIDQ